MIFKKTKIEGLYMINPELKKDERGYFARAFCKKEIFDAIGIKFDIRHINQSLTKKKGIIRGMHFQTSPKAEGKIVQCLQGKIFDVAVDLRKNSPTFGQWIAEELSADNKKMFFIPKGFAHGLQTLENDCIVQYLMSEFYSADNASGVRFDDPFLNIKWPIKPTVISEKDKNWPLIKNNL